KRVDRSRARSQDAAAPRRSARQAAARSRRAGLRARQQSHRRANRAPHLRARRVRRAAGRSRDRVGNADLIRGVQTIGKRSLIVFDLDGTLVDSRRDLATSINQLLIACGAAPLDERAVGTMVGEGAQTLVARAFAAARRTPPLDALDRFLAIYNAHLLDDTRPYPGMIRVLETLAP